MGGVGTSPGGVGCLILEVIFVTDRFYPSKSVFRNLGVFVGIEKNEKTSQDIWGRVE